MSNIKYLKHRKSFDPSAWHFSGSESDVKICEDINLRNFALINREFLLNFRNWRADGFYPMSWERTVSGKRKRSQSKVVLKALELGLLTTMLNTPRTYKLTAKGISLCERSMSVIDVP